MTATVTPEILARLRTLQDRIGVLQQALTPAGGLTMLLPLDLVAAHSVDRLRREHEVHLAGHADTGEHRRRWPARLRLDLAVHVGQL